MISVQWARHSVSLRWHNPVQVLRVLSQALKSHPQQIEFYVQLNIDGREERGKMCYILGEQIPRR